MKHIPIATRYMVILGRTYADGSEQDYKHRQQAASTIQDHSALGVG
jgi:hypothetical protein